MLTKEYSEAYEGLPDEVKPAIMALSVLIARIGSLPKADRDDMFELVLAWRDAKSSGDRQSIRRAMEEILAQIPVTAKPMPLAEPKPMSKSSEAWASHVGGKIKVLREAANLNQSELARMAGLTQPHVSRLENAEYTATHKTLVKIATALGVEIGELDPYVD